VVAPDGEQLVLALAGLAVEVFDPADDQPGGDGLVLLRGERGVFHLGTPASDTQQPSWSSQMARGYRMGVQMSSPMAAIAAWMLGFICTVTEKHAPDSRTAPVNAAE